MKHLGTMVIAITASLFFSAVATAGISALPDVSGDNQPDIASRANAAAPRTVDIISGADGSTVRSINFLSSTWSIIDHETLLDGNGDNIADDPAVAVLGRNSTNGKIRVQLKYAQDGSTVRTPMNFFAGGSTPVEDWTPLAVGIVEDSNGDGNSSDRGVLVLASKNAGTRIVAELRLVSNNDLAGRWNFFGTGFTPIAIVGVNPAGGNPKVAVAATNNNNGQTLIQQRRIDNGTKTNIFGYGPNVVVTDMTVLPDINNNGTANDPGYVLIGLDSRNGNRLRVRNASNGNRVVDGFIINADWTSTSVAILEDLNGNNRPEFAALSEQSVTGVIRIRDLNSNNTIDTFTVDIGQIPLVGSWREASGFADVLGIAFFEDGTYLHVEYIAGETDDFGMEWGTFTRDPITGQIVVNVIFDANGDIGLSDFDSQNNPPFLYVNDAGGGDAAVTIDENGNGNIDDSLTFVREPQDGLIGTWVNNETENELLLFHFMSDNTYIHAEYDDNPGNEINGMEWGTWSRNNSTGELTVTQTFDENGDTGLTDFANTSARVFASVNGDVLTLSFDEDGNGSIDGSLDFDRAF